MALNFGTAGAYLPTIGPNGYADPTGMPLASYNPAALTDWLNPRAGLGQDVLNFYKNYQGAPDTVQSGRFAGLPQLDFNKMYRTPGSAYDPTKALQANNGDNMPGTVSLRTLDDGQGGYMYTPTTSNPGHNGDPYFVYNPDGSFKEVRAFEKDPMSNPLVGVASVIGAGLGFGAIGAAAAGGAGAAGMGAGAATGADMGAFYGGLDGGATLGGGASVGGGSALGGVGSFAPSTAGLGAGMAGLNTSTMGAGSAELGSGLGSSGTGLSFGGGSTGLTANTGAGLSLTNGSTGLGLTGANSGIGAGLGTGLAGGTGSLLGPAALAGTTTLSTGLTLPSLGSAAASAAGSALAPGSSSGVPPPANPNVTSPSTINIPGLGDVPLSTLAQWGIPLAGALAGSQGVQKTTTQTQSMDPRMDSLFYGGIAPATAATLGAQMPAAHTAGNQMLSVGSGLLGQTAPTTATNPYLKSVADDMQRRTQELLGANNLATQGNFVSAGGLGGSRQGVAQGVAAGKAADYLQGNVANLYGTAYTGDQNRLLQQQTLGAGLLSQGIDTQFQPLKDAAGIYSPFTGFGTTNQNQSQGGGALGALGGALGATQIGHAVGWW